jgi:hypothetical protein
MTFTFSNPSVPAPKPFVVLRCQSSDTHSNWLRPPPELAWIRPSNDSGPKVPSSPGYCGPSNTSSPSTSQDHRRPDEKLNNLSGIYPSVIEPSPHLKSLSAPRTIETQNRSDFVVLRCQSSDTYSNWLRPPPELAWIRPSNDSGPKVSSSPGCSRPTNTSPPHILPENQRPDEKCNNPSGIYPSVPEPSPHLESLFAPRTIGTYNRTNDVIVHPTMILIPSPSLPITTSDASNASSHSQDAEAKESPDIHVESLDRIVDDSLTSTQLSSDPSSAPRNREDSNLSAEGNLDSSRLLEVAANHGETVLTDSLLETGTTAVAATTRHNAQCEALNSDQHPGTRNHPMPKHSPQSVQTMLELVQSKLIPLSSKVPLKTLRESTRLLTYAGSEYLPPRALGIALVERNDGFWDGANNCLLKCLRDILIPQPRSMRDLLIQYFCGLDPDSKLRLGYGILSHESSESLADLNESEMTALCVNHILNNGELDACLLIEMMEHAAIRGQINVILKAPYDIVCFKENAQGTEAAYMASFVYPSSNPRPVALIMCNSHGTHFERLRASMLSPTFSEGAPTDRPAPSSSQRTSSTTGTQAGCRSTIPRLKPKATIGLINPRLSFATKNPFEVLGTISEDSPGPMQTDVATQNANPLRAISSHVQRRRHPPLCAVHYGTRKLATEPISHSPSGQSRDTSDPSKQRLEYSFLPKHSPARQRSPRPITLKDFVPSAWGLPAQTADSSKCPAPVIRSLDPSTWPTPIKILTRQTSQGSARDQCPRKVPSVDTKAYEASESSPLNRQVSTKIRRACKDGFAPLEHPASALTSAAAIIRGSDICSPCENSADQLGNQMSSVRFTSPEDTHADSGNVSTPAVATSWKATEVRGTTHRPRVHRRRQGRRRRGGRKAPFCYHLVHDESLSSGPVNDVPRACLPRRLYSDLPSDMSTTLPQQSSFSLELGPITLPIRLNNRLFSVKFSTLAPFNLADFSQRATNMLAPNSRHTPQLIFHGCPCRDTSLPVRSIRRLKDHEIPKTWEGMDWLKHCGGFIEVHIPLRGGADSDAASQQASSSCQPPTLTSDLDWTAVDGALSRLAEGQSSLACYSMQVQTLALHLSSFIGLAQFDALHKHIQSWPIDAHSLLTPARVASLADILRRLPVELPPLPSWYASDRWIDVRINGLRFSDLSVTAQQLGRGRPDLIVSALLDLLQLKLPAIRALRLDRHNPEAWKVLVSNIKIRCNPEQSQFLSTVMLLPPGEQWRADLLSNAMRLTEASYITLNSTDTFVEVELHPRDAGLLKSIGATLGCPVWVFMTMLARAFRRAWNITWVQCRYGTEVYLPNSQRSVLVDPQSGPGGILVGLDILSLIELNRGDRLTILELGVANQTPVTILVEVPAVPKAPLYRMLNSVDPSPALQVIPLPASESLHLTRPQLVIGPLPRNWLSRLSKTDERSRHIEFLSSTKKRLTSDEMVAQLIARPGDAPFAVYYWATNLPKALEFVHHLSSEPGQRWFEEITSYRPLAIAETRVPPECIELLGANKLRQLLKLPRQGDAGSHVSAH